VFQAIETAKFISRRTGLVLGLLWLLPAALWAASFTVNPVRVDLAAERPYAVMRIANGDDAPVTLQARAYTWTGDETRGGLTPTDDIILNPPVFTVAPGSTRFMRLGLRTANRGTAELTYRLILQEVPKAENPAEGGAAIRTILRISIPIFAAPKAVAKPRLEWTLQEVAPTKFKLVSTNTGNAHVQIREISISPMEKMDAVKRLSAPVYVLPGKTHDWEVEAAELVGQSTMKVVAKTDVGMSENIVGVTKTDVAKSSN
jgi:fimbrial chaperone protein